jgi:ribosomal protein S18 acetylase RimI-like enzyme
VTSSDIALRLATGNDTDAVVSLYDQAVAWLAARGRTGQWGTTPFSARPDAVALIRGRAGSGTMWLAHTGAQLLGAIVLGDKPPVYIKPAVGSAGEPEIYISGFITSRALRARTAGRTLLDHAITTARRAGINLLRLDCYAGGDGGLVRYYESVGFQQVSRFIIELMGAPYTGCLLQKRLTAVSPQDIRNV